LRDSQQTVRECPNCGGTAFATVGPDEIRCEYCGTTVALPRSAPGVRPCPRCGFENEGSARYCGECGLAVAKWTHDEKPKANLAIVSMLVSVIGTFFVPFAAPILGLILAYKARSQARATGGRSGSEEMARMAIIVAWVVLGTSIVPVCAFPVLLGGEMGLAICRSASELPRMLLGG
jgi:ribosomal protein S27AE